ncbi:MAG TPA: BrnA antitoxin family protein [Blastocatellia bacterium]|nr:BrnA antitoxin family protein [Blastocatellia bacterium]
MNKPSQTDWERIEKLTDEEIDTSDIRPLDDTFFAKASLRIPRSQVPVTMHVDADLLDWFKAQGEEFENVINAALRSYVESQKEQHS